MNKQETQKKARKYILTGGPGAGKSSIILELEQKGGYTIREAAEDIIRYLQAQGNKEPWLNKDFQDKILELQLQRESKIPEGTEIVYTDRGIPDGLAYYLRAGREPSERMKKALQNLDYEKKVFLVESLGHCKKTEVRREGEEEALRLENLLERVYTELGYEVKRVRPGTIEERANYILNETRPLILNPMSAGRGRQTTATRMEDEKE